MQFLKKVFNLDRKFMDQLTLASTMGLHMVTGTLVGAGLGYLLDRWLGTAPWLTLCLLATGVAAGYRMIYQDLNKLMRMESGKGKVPENHEETTRKD